MMSNSEQNKHPVFDIMAYMYGLERRGIKPGLARMAAMMKVLGHPEQKFRSVHISGTNGKGSTAAFMDAALRQAGYRIGLYTSPHIYSFNERIRVGGVPIGDKDMVQLAEELRAVIEREKISATFFEFTTTLAYMHLARAKLDLAIIEVGMGGAYDATNVIHPRLAVITNIGKDHMEYMGNSKRQIALEKAGIIKEGVGLVTGERNKNILNIFSERCRHHNSQMQTVGQSLSATPITSTLDEQTFEVQGLYNGRVTIPLLGRHQIDNACTALLALNQLSLQGLSLSWRDIVKGLAQTRWEGRLDVISKSPLIIVDGAHNEDAARALHVFLQTLEQLDPFDRLGIKQGLDVLILGEKKGKDLSVLHEQIVPLFNHVIVTQGSYEPEDPANIARKISPYHHDVQVIPPVDKALAAGKVLLPRNGTMLVTGSLYMIADALAVLRQKEKARSRS